MHLVSHPLDLNIEGSIATRATKADVHMEQSIMIHYIRCRCSLALCNSYSSRKYIFYHVKLQSASLHPKVLLLNF